MAKPFIRFAKQAGCMRNQAFAQLLKSISPPILSINSDSSNLSNTNVFVLL
jgi:hypothetical protein